MGGIAPGDRLYNAIFYKINSIVEYQDLDCMVSHMQDSMSCMHHSDETPNVQVLLPVDNDNEFTHHDPINLIASII